MPVYDRGYTHWQSSGGRTLPAWLVIAKRGIVGPLKSRWLLILILMAWVPAIVKGGIIYVKLKAGNLADLLSNGWASIGPDGFLSFLEGQRFFVFVLLAIVGAGLIATDRRDNGLSLYFSRPLSLPDYLGGKMAIIVFYYFLITLLPVYALCLLSYLVAPGATGLDMLVLMPLKATAYCLLSGVSISLVLLAFSSLGKRSIFVMVWWAIMVTGTEAISAIAGGFGSDGMQAVNFLGQYHNLGAFFFSTPPRIEVPISVSLVMILAWTALGILVLRRQVRPVEVVS